MAAGLTTRAFRTIWRNTADLSYPRGGDPSRNRLVLFPGQDGARNRALTGPSLLTSALFPVVPVLSTLAHMGITVQSKRGRVTRETRALNRPRSEVMARIDRQSATMAPTLALILTNKQKGRLRASTLDPWLGNCIVPCDTRQERRTLWDAWRRGMPCLRSIHPTKQIPR